MSKIPIVKKCTQSQPWVHCIKLWYASQEEYQKKYDGLAGRFDRAKERLEEVSGAIMEKQAHKEKTEMFLAELERMDGMVTEFKEKLWFSLVEFVTVHSREKVVFTFKDGTEIEV